MGIITSIAHSPPIPAEECQQTSEKAASKKLAADELLSSRLRIEKYLNTPETLRSDLESNCLETLSFLQKCAKKSNAEELHPSLQKIAKFFEESFLKSNHEQIEEQLNARLLVRFHKNHVIQEKDIQSLIAELYDKNPKRLKQYLLTWIDVKNIEILCVLFRQYPIEFEAYLGLVKEKGIWEYLTQEDRIEIAKGIAKQRGHTISNLIEDFEIQDEKARIEIAKIAVLEDPYAVTLSLRSYNIEDQNGLNEIALLGASKHGKEFSQAISYYKITDLSVLVEIYDKIAEKDDLPEDMEVLMANHISQCEDQALLLKFALAAIEGPGHFNLRDIKKFRIQDEQDRIKLAKAASRIPYGEAVVYLEEFEITDKKALLELAELCIDQEPETTSKYLHKFQIEDPQERIRLAKRAAQKDGQGISKYIQNYQIEDEQVLIEIAKLAAVQSGRMALYIQNYAIKDQAGLVEIAKLVAEQPNNEVSSSIQMFGIQSETSLGEIAKIAVQHVSNTCEHIQNYNLKDGEVLVEIARIAAEKYPLFFDRHIEKFPLLIIIQELGRRFHFKTDQLVDALSHRLVNGKKEPLEEFVVKNQLVWLTQSLLRIERSPFSKQLAIYGDLLQELLQKCVSIHNPQLRYTLVDLSFQVLAHKECFQIFKMLRKQKNRAHFFLPYLTSLILLNRGVDSKIVGDNVIHTLNRLDTDIKDRKFNQAFYRFMELCSNTEQDPADIAYLIQFAFTPPKGQTPYSKKELISRLNTLRNIGQLGGLSALSKEKLEPHQDNLEHYTALLFQALIPIKERSDFTVRYQQTFDSCRMPTAILTYAASLNTLNSPEKEEALNALAKYVEWVFEGVDSFKEQRLNTDHNVHLDMIFSVRPELKLLWAKGTSRTLVIENSTETSIDVYQYLYTKIVTDQHAQLPLLSAYLKASDAEKESLYTALEKTHPTKAEEKAQLMLMQATRKEFQALPLSEKHRQIDEIIGLLSSNKSSFLNDLSDLKQMLNPEKKSFKGLSIVDSDDPYDLLLCGTEILGSCQRVDGDSEKNKGLLGYLLDGKNRLLAIKGPNGIISRVLLRLTVDAMTGQPVLYLSRMYPDNISLEHKQALIEFAKEKAQTMGLELVALKGNPDSVGYPNPICSLAGPAPFEYVDEVGGVVTGGAYTARVAYYL